jgi:2,6-dihydroxypyridine 3-monooxygenase
VSIHPGRVQQRFVDEMRETAGRVLPPAMAEVVQLTEQPYLQTVFDVRVPAMAQGRVAVIGDAAFAARPHAAAGTAKAADDAWTLYDHLAAGHGDIPTTLKGWEPAQLERGNQLIDRVSAMGARSQLTNTWTPGDPDLRFGLYAAGV